MHFDAVFVKYCGFIYSSFAYLIKAFANLIKIEKKLRVIEICITKTWLYNFDPLKPGHFYIVKLGFTGVYIIFHISAQNIDCGYSPRRF